MGDQSLELSRAISDKQAEAFSLWGLGVVTAIKGDIVRGIPLLEQSAALYQSLGDKLGQATAITWMSLNNSDLERAKAFLFESLGLFRELGHLAGIAVCLSELAHRTIWGGDFSSPIPWLEEARGLYQQLGNTQREGDVLSYYGLLNYWQGDLKQANDYYEESIRLYEKVGNYWNAAWSRVQLAYAGFRQGEIVQAREMFGFSIGQFQKLNNTIGLVYAIEGLAAMNVDQGGPIRAAQLFAWADAMREKIGDFRPPVEQASVERDLAVIHSKLADAEFASLSAVGRALTMEQAIALALEE
jgi:tetratricopeptide (TPR) repeat protein